MDKTIIVHQPFNLATSALDLLTTLLPMVMAVVYIASIVWAIKSVIDIKRYLKTIAENSKK